MTAPTYVRRYTRVLQALEVLAAYPEGLSLADLASELGVKQQDLREELLAYYTAEPLSRAAYALPSLAWLSATGEEEDPQQAEVLVLTDPDALAELGVVRLSTAEMAAVWHAGRILEDYEPENTVLVSALDLLAERWLNRAQAEPEPGSGIVPELRRACEANLRVTFRYAREWRPGISERTVEPYRLLHTRRGWELDAGPLDEQGNPRTFLLSNISDLRVSGDTFERPAGIDAVLERNRAQLTVTLSMPQRWAWSAEVFADDSERLAADTETVTVRAVISPPYERRLALILAPAMGEGMLLDHRELAPMVRGVADRLLRHHGFCAD